MARVQLSIPPGFDFERTVRSHGWYDLLPFRYSAEQRTLALTFHTETGVATATLSPAPGGRGVVADVPGRTAAARREVLTILGNVLRLDEDLAPVEVALRAAPHLVRCVTLGGGRLMRAPTMFEDTVKMICTVNCSWSLTRLMVQRLVENVGAPGPDGHRAFPTAAVLADQPVSFYRDVVRAGYRGPYLQELAKRVAGGDLDLESLRERTGTADAARTRLQSIKGVGDYAADNLLRLLGYHDRLGIDSWCRATYRRLYPRTAALGIDAAIARRYRRFAPYQGLAMWLDLTRDWHTPGPS